MKLSPAIALAALLSACASTPSAKEVASLGTTALVGTWISELDEARLTIAKDGSFTAERGEKRATGHWTTDGNAIVLTNTGEPCAGIEGAYVPEVVRDTVRFTMRRDDCPAREEHMAWPWKRAK